MLPRFFVGALPGALPDHELQLPDGAARHVQVLRMQPGQCIQVFDGAGQEWVAEIGEMGRKHVAVRLQSAVPNHRELPVRITLAVGMPANDRMDTVIEKATELGAYAIQPLMCQRSVLRLDGDRANKKVAHWQGVAVAASEQCGRAVVPVVHPVQSLNTWLRSEAASSAQFDHRAVLSLREARSIRSVLQAATATDSTQAVRWVFLNGPEGGLNEEEEASALQAGWQAVTLGARTLRADTAPLAALSVMAAHYEG